MAAAPLQEPLWPATCEGLPCPGLTDSGFGLGASMRTAKKTNYYYCLLSLSLFTSNDSPMRKQLEPCSVCRAVFTLLYCLSQRNVRARFALPACNVLCPHSYPTKGIFHVSLALFPSFTRRASELTRGNACAWLLAEYLL